MPAFALSISFSLPSLSTLHLSHWTKSTAIIIILQWVYSHRSRPSFANISTVINIQNDKYTIKIAAIIKTMASSSFDFGLRRWVRMEDFFCASLFWPLKMYSHKTFSESNSTNEQHKEIILWYKEKRDMIARSTGCETVVSSPLSIIILSKYTLM